MQIISFSIQASHLVCIIMIYLFNSQLMSLKVSACLQRWQLQSMMPGMPLKVDIPSSSSWSEFLGFLFYCSVAVPYNIYANWTCLCWIVSISFNSDVFYFYQEIYICEGLYGMISCSNTGTVKKLLHFLPFFVIIKKTSSTK